MSVRRVTNCKLKKLINIRLVWYWNEVAENKDVFE